MGRGAGARARRRGVVTGVSDLAQSALEAAPKSALEVGVRLQTGPTGDPQALEQRPAGQGVPVV